MKTIKQQSHRISVKLMGGCGCGAFVMGTTNMGQDAITIKLSLEPWGRGGGGIGNQVLPIKKTGSPDSVTVSQTLATKFTLMNLQHLLRIWICIYAYPPSHCTFTALQALKIVTYYRLTSSGLDQTYTNYPI